MGGKRNPNGKKFSGKEVAERNRGRHKCEVDLLTLLYLVIGIPNFPCTECPILPKEPKKPRRTVSNYSKAMAEYYEDLRTLPDRIREYPRLKAIYEKELRLKVIDFFNECRRKFEENGLQLPAEFNHIVETHPTDDQSQLGSSQQVRAGSQYKFFFVWRDGNRPAPRINNVAGQLNGNGSVQQNGNGLVREDGNSLVRENGNGFNQSNGSSFSQRSGSALSQRSGGALSQRSGSTFSQRSGSAFSQRSGSALSQRSGSALSQRSGSSSARYFPNQAHSVQPAPMPVHSSQYTLNQAHSSQQTSNLARDFHQKCNLYAQQAPNYVYSGQQAPNYIYPDQQPRNCINPEQQMQNYYDLNQQNGLDSVYPSQPAPSATCYPQPASSNTYSSHHAPSATYYPQAASTNTYTLRQNENLSEQLAPLHITTNFQPQSQASQISTSGSLFSPQYITNNAEMRQNHNGPVQHSQSSFTYSSGSSTNCDLSSFDGRLSRDSGYTNQSYEDWYNNKYLRSNQVPGQQTPSLPASNYARPQQLPASLQGMNKAIRQQMSTDNLPRLSRKHKQPNGIITDEMKSSQNHGASSSQSHGPSSSQSHGASSSQSHGASSSQNHGPSSSQSHGPSSSQSHGPSSPQSHAASSSQSHGLSSPQNQSPAESINRSRKFWEKFDVEKFRK